MLSTGLLWVDVLRRVDELSVTRSDNTQWTVSQLEVDLLRFALAVDEAQATVERDDADAMAGALAAVRQRYDIFYSRSRTLGRADTYRLLLEDAEYAAARGVVDGFLERLMPAMDGGDPRLAAALPSISGEIAAAHDDVRTLALRGLHVFAEISDRQRAEIVALILRTGLVTVLLLAILAVALVMMVQAGRRAAAAARRTADANRNLAMIVNTSLDAIVLADETGRVRAYNPAAEATFGWTRDEAIGQPMTDLMIPEHHRAAHDAGMARYLSGQGTRVIGSGRVQLDARHKSGRIFPVELSLSSERDGDGHIFVSFLRDITKRREAEDALTAARDEALAAARKKDEFLAVMSHEIRTPLNGMLGAMELMGSSRLAPHQQRWLDAMRGSGQLLLRHVNDVLDLSRFDAGETGLRRERIDLRALCAEVITSQESAARSAGNALSLTVSEGVPEAVITDGRRLSQVLLNLVGNANKFTRDGAVVVTVERHEAAEGRTGIEIHVTDTGIGIPAEDRDRIFEEFVMLDSSYDRGAAGTGLGLAISRRIVRSMGGSIDVLDAEGGGADFRILLDLEAAPQRATSRPAPSRPIAPARSLDILLVEDNPINRELLGEMLRLDGHRVTEAVDGPNSIEMATERRFDLVLMDISMPGMNGVEAATAIRESHGPNSATPIVAATAHALPEEVDRFRRAGMARTLTKPIDRAALRRLLADLPGLRPGVPAPHAVDAAPAAVDAQPLLDEDLVAELCEGLGDARFADLLRDFLAQGEALSRRLAPGIDGQDPAAVIADLHALAGAAGLVGARALHAGLAEIETVYKTEGSLPDAAGIAALRRLWDDTRDSFADLLD